MLMNHRECREADQQDGVGARGTRPNVGDFDLKPVRTGVGAALRTLHSDVLREEVPEAIAELLKQLDQQKDADKYVTSASADTAAQQEVVVQRSP